MFTTSRPVREPNAPPAAPPLRLVASLVLGLLLGVAGRTSAGGFAAGTTTNFTVAAGPRAVVTGDLNGDGILDMVANGAGGSGVSVYLGDGGGAFHSVAGFAANAGGVPVLGDFNLDGKLDVAIPISSPISAVQFYNGVGDGSFTSGNTLGNLAAAEFLVAGDFNGDGKLDLASCGNTTSSNGFVRVFLNTTSSPGGFETFSTNADVAVGVQPRGIAAATNLFGTNSLDLVTANQSAGSVTLLKNNGSGVFGNRLDIATQKSSYAIATGMLWTDAISGQNPRPQIVTANKDSAAVTVVRFNPNTLTWVTQKVATAADPRFVSLGDTDGNLNLDVVVSAYNSNVVSILSPANDGTATWMKPHVDIPAGSHPWMATVVNPDHDMKPDLLVAVSGNNRASWIHGAPRVGWALGDTIPGFSAKDQFSDTFVSSSLAGKWTFLDFCSNWCYPCRVFMAPTTQKAWLNWYRHPSVSFEYVTALIDGNTPGIASTQADAIEWSGQYGIFRPVLHSGDLPGAGVAVAARDAETYATPTLRLIDPSGRIVWMSMGAVFDTTIARVVANAAGVAIPLTQFPTFGSGLETVTYGAQQVSYASDPGSGWTWPYYLSPGAFGENFTSDFSMTRHLETLTEDWQLNLVYYDLDPSHMALPTANDWQITVSNLQLDGGTRTLPPGMGATVVATDTFGVDHALPAPVSVSWSGGTLTFGAIPKASLAAVPPIRFLTLSLTMNLTGWTAGVDDGPVANTLALRTPMPNPARSASRLAWSQPRAGDARLDVFDVNGRHVRTVASGFRAAGAHAESWNLADEQGARVGAGLYFLRLAVAGEKAMTQRITVVR